MNKATKNYMIALTQALSSRNPSKEQWDFIYTAKEKCPKLFARCEKLAQEVRRRVDANKLDTWTQTLNDEKQAN